MSGVDERPNFEGHVERECGDHRTVGPHRAWCFDCTEWCSATAPCKGCEVPQMRAEISRLQDALAAALAQNDEEPPAEAGGSV